MEEKKANKKKKMKKKENKLKKKSIDEGKVSKEEEKPWRKQWVMSIKKNSEEMRLKGQVEYNNNLKKEKK